MADLRTTPVRHVVLDLDGTVYKGDRVFPETRPFLATLDELRIGYTFLTNNTSRGTSDYVDKLAAMGIEVDASKILTPVPATMNHLREQGWRTLFVLGTTALCAEFAAAGFVVFSESDAAKPDAVVVGFDTGLTYTGLCRAAWWISQDLPFVATHPDFVCPTDESTVLVDCGSICAALTAATGRPPDATFGKPDPSMVRFVAIKSEVAVTEIAVVGDRLYTDIAMANRAGALSVLVLTGETTDEQVKELDAGSDEVPDVICSSLATFETQLRSWQA